MNIKIALYPDAPPKEFSIQRFEELFEISYFPKLEFADWKVENYIRKKCARAHKKGRIGELALWLGKYHGHQLDRAEIPDLTIRWLHEKIGYGVITNMPLKKWGFIGEYTGLLRSRNLIIPDINDYCFMYPRQWWGLKGFTIDSLKCGSYTRFINHSDNPNCESVSVLHGGVFHIVFRALKEIPAGTELTYDYGGIYWHKRKKIQEPFESLIPTD